MYLCPIFKLIYLMLPILQHVYPQVLGASPTENLGGSSAVEISIPSTMGFGTFGAFDPLVNIEKAMENGPFIDVYRCFLMICVFKMVFLW